MASSDSLPPSAGTEIEASLDGSGSDILTAAEVTPKGVRAQGVPAATAHDWGEKTSRRWDLFWKCYVSSGHTRATWTIRLQRARLQHNRWLFERGGNGTLVRGIWAIPNLSDDA